ncbi:unnamed protein product [Calypogeia fissa]
MPGGIRTERRSMAAFPRGPVSLIKREALIMIFPGMSESGGDRTIQLGIVSSSPDQAISAYCHSLSAESTVVDWGLGEWRVACGREGNEGIQHERKEDSGRTGIPAGHQTNKPKTKKNPATQSKRKDLLPEDPKIRKKEEDLGHPVPAVRTERTIRKSKTHMIAIRDILIYRVHGQKESKNHYYRTRKLRCQAPNDRPFHPARGY